MSKNSFKTNAPARGKPCSTEAHPTGPSAAVLTLRAQSEPLFEDDRHFIALQQTQPPARPEHSGFWIGRLTSVGPSAEEVVKFGSALWDKLAIEVPLELTERLLHLKNLDKDTARAAQSALLGAFNSSLDPSGLEVALYTLSTFMNVHPSFSHMAAAPEFTHPFGASTTYELVAIKTPEN